MAKADLGQKRICVSCSTRFYDLAKSPAICPKCGTVQPAEQPRLRRGGNVAELRKLKKAAAVEDADTDAEPEAAEDEESEEGVLEDTSDLDDDAAAIGDEVEIGTDGDEPET